VLPFHLKHVTESIWSKAIEGSTEEFLFDGLPKEHIGGCIQKFPDWSPGVRTAGGTALCHSVLLYRYFMSQSNELRSHNPLCCFSTSNTKGKSIFLYGLSPETFGYTLICRTTESSTRWEVPELADQHMRSITVSVFQVSDVKFELSHVVLPNSNLDTCYTYKLI
jgi:hypothetical protein